jgi:hypothetical protein
VLCTTVSGCVLVPTPKLTAEDRKADIQFLADWARDCSPLVALAEKHKGSPSYEALLPKYLDYAEQAESNEEFYRVVRGYYDLICSAGHCALIGESTLKLARIAIFLGIVDLGIGPSMVEKARYWPRLANGNLYTHAHPPFRIVCEDDKFVTADDWKVDDFTVPKGSQIVKVNGMDCPTYLSYLSENTSLKYDAFPKDWTKECLLIVDEGDEFKGWQVDFLLPDNSVYGAFVPMTRGYGRSVTMARRCCTVVPDTEGHPAPKESAIRSIKPKENCTCIELTDEIGYIRIKAMSSSWLRILLPGILDKDRKTIKAFLENAHGKYRKLIVDLRNNGGGYVPYVYKNLICPFLDEPAVYDQVAGIRRRYRDELRPSVLKSLRKRLSTKKEYVVNVEESDAPEGFDPGEWVFYRLTRRIEPRHRYDFDGNIYILTNGGTFSAADVYADAVKRIGFAKLVGRNTKGGGAAYIGPHAIRLPASGMIFRVETEIVINPDGRVNELFGTRPDVELPPADPPKSITREELLKDEWVKHIIHEM